MRMLFDLSLVKLNHALSSPYQQCPGRFPMSSSSLKTSLVLYHWHWDRPPAHRMTRAWSRRTRAQLKQPLLRLSDYRLS
jgi:hypothetical protein